MNPQDTAVLDQLETAIYAALCSQPVSAAIGTDLLNQVQDAINMARGAC